MAVNVATLTAKLVADTKGLKQGLGKANREIKSFEKKTTSATGRVGGAFGKLKGAAGGLLLGAGAVAAVKIMKDAVAAASNLEESINAVDVSFGEAAAGIHELGRTSVDQFGLSTRAVNDAAVGMSAFADKINAADPADAFKNVIQRATDFGSVMNITTEETLEKFRAGLSGEAEPLKRFGINLSSAEVEAVALREGIISVGEKMTEGQKIQARYAAIMEQTAKTAGDFANTSDGLAGSQKKLSAAWEEAQVVLGEQLTPALAEVLTQLTKLLGGTRAASRNTVQGFTAIRRSMSGLAKAFPTAFIIEMIDAWSDQDEMLFQVTRRLDQYGLSLSAGSNEANVFAGALVALVRDGNAYEGTLKALIDATGISNDKLRESIMLMFANRTAFGLTATEIDNMERVLVKLDWQEQTDALGPFVDEIDEAGDKAKTAAVMIRKMWQAAKLMASPVLRAKEAVAAYNEHLTEMQEDGVASLEEMDTAVELRMEMIAAKLEVGQGNVQAYGAEWVSVAGDLKETTEVATRNAGDLDAFVFTEIDRAADRVEQLADKLNQTEFQARITIDVPPASAFDRALEAALNRAARENPNLFDERVT